MNFMSRSFLRAIWMVVLSCVLAGAAAAAAPQSISAQHAIKDDDGDPIANFTLTAPLAAQLAKLPGQIAVGNPQGDVTLVQFYDLNCPYCRLAAVDVDKLLQSDKKLKLVFVPYAVLSVQSVQGALIEMGASKELTPEQFVEFHRRVYANRGTIDGPRVLAAAAEMGIDPKRLAAASNTESTLDILRESATVGGQAGLAATPAYIIGGVAILGHPGLKPLQRVIQAMRDCGKVVCAR